MGLFKLIKNWANKLISVPKAIIKAIWTGLSAILGFIFGTIFGWLYYGLLLLLNIGKERISLSTCIKGVLNKYYSSVNLDSVRIIPNATGIPGSHKALTEEDNIFWKNSFSENNIDDLKLLLHELVHVKQYEEYGKEVFYIIYGYEYVNELFSYSNIPLEKEAKDYVLQIYDKFILDYIKDCNPSLQIKNKRSDWSWLFW